MAEPFVRTHVTKRPLSPDDLPPAELSPGTVPARGKSRVKGTERRAKFLEAAGRIIVEQGVSGVTMEEVALRTDVNKRLGYRYFDNREHLVRALFEDRLAEATHRADALMPRNAKLKDIVSINIRVWLDLADRDGPILSRLLSDQDVIPDVARGVVERATRNWAATLSEALNMPPLVAQVLSRIFLTALRGAVEALGGGMATAAEISEIYATAVLAGAEAVAARFHGGGGANGLSAGAKV